MTKPALIAKITAKDGQRDELVAVFRQAVDRIVADEPGTEVYALHVDDNDPNVVWFYELYASAEAQAAHSGGDALKSVGPLLAPLLAGRPELFRLSPVVAKGLAL